MKVMSPMFKLSSAVPEASIRLGYVEDDSDVAFLDGSLQELYTSKETTVL
jgi:hypothetical protein